MKRLDGPVRKQMQGTIDKIISADPTTMAQTHPLTGPLKGWNATKGSRGHRVVHRPNDDGGIHIGYVGLHEYDKAIQRLTSLTAGKNGPDYDNLSFHQISDGEEDGLVAVHPWHGPVGMIQWGTEGHFLEDEITGVAVHKDHQRRGVARQLLQRAKHLRPNLEHSESRSDEGEAWARSVDPESVYERMGKPETVAPFHADDYRDRISRTPR